MLWASALSRQATTFAAVNECTEQIQAQMGVAPVDLALVFGSSDLWPNFQSLGVMIQKQLNAQVVLGCSAGGLIGAGEELEQETGLSVTVARLPGVKLTPFYLDKSDLPDPDAPPSTWEQRLDVSGPAQFIILAQGDEALEPFLAGLDFAYPHSPKVGGIASGQQRALFVEGRTYTQGVAGIALQGNIVMDTLVAQGCRPIGNPYQITDCQDHFLLELNGKPALQTLQELFGELTQEDQELARTALFVGLLADEFKMQPKQGDFLIRGLMGVDRRTGGLAIGQTLRLGQTLQFHVRDANASSHDLETLLHTYVQQAGATTVRGAVLFSCLGRGSQLYGRPHHDTQLLQHHLGALAVGGFFCNGEIGPVGNTTYLHGWTSAIGLFRPFALQK